MPTLNIIIKPIAGSGQLYFVHDPQFPPWALAWNYWKKTIQVDVEKKIKTKAYRTYETLGTFMHVQFTILHFATLLNNKIKYLVQFI